MALFDFDGIRRGFYTDAYFNNIRNMLRTLSDEGYAFGGVSPVEELKGVDVSRFLW